MSAQTLHPPKLDTLLNEVSESGHDDGRHWAADYARPNLLMSTLPLARLPSCTRC